MMKDASGVVSGQCLLFQNMMKNLLKYLLLKDLNQNGKQQK